MSRLIDRTIPFYLNDGSVNALGTVYFGEPNQNAKTNPKVPFLDSALTVPATATQPLTAGGQLSSNLFVEGEYSLISDDSSGVQVEAFFNWDQVSGEIPSVTKTVTTATEGQQTFTTNGPYVVGVNSLRVFVNGVAQVSGVDYQELNGSEFEFFESLSSGDEVVSYSGAFNSTLTNSASLQSLIVNGLARASTESYLENQQVPDYATLRAIPSAQLAVGDRIWVDGFADAWEVKVGSVIDDNGSLLILDDGANKYAEQTEANVSSKTYNLIGNGSDETIAFNAMLAYARSNNKIINIENPQSTYNVTKPSDGSARDILLDYGGIYRWDGLRWEDLTPEVEPFIIYVSPTIDDQSQYPPFYNSLASAMAAITDNSKRRPYDVQLLSGIHDAREILLKDYVDIRRSPLSGAEVIINHDFDPGESFKIRDIFKTANTPYDATDTFPIRCKIQGLTIQGQNLNYCVHMDFNDDPDIDLKIEDCILFNGDAATTASTADYALGVGIYGGQKLVCNRTLFYGRYDAGLPIEKQQGSGWIVHNRASQTRSCSVTFNDCKSLKGFYGGRIVDYGSTQEDIISINGGVLLGELGDLLCFSNGLPGTVAASITVTGDVPITRVALEQDIDGLGTIWKCEFPIVIQGFSEMYKAGEALETGDLVSLNSYGNTASKALTSIRYKHLIGGVVINPVAFGGRVAVQKRGIAAVKFTPASISSNTEISNSSTTNGEVQVAVTGDGVLGSTIVSTGFSTGVTPGLAWVSLGYAGTK